MSETRGVSADEIYWATKPPQDLIPALVERRKDFEGMLVASGLYGRIERNLRYFHGLFHVEGELSGMAIQMGDEEGGTALANINHFKSNIDQAVTFIASEKPAWKAKARVPGFRARRDTILVGQLLDAYIEQWKADETLLDTARYAYVLSQGFIYLYWDWMQGRSIRPDENDDPINQGDLAIDSPTLLDIFWDYSVRDWPRVPWIDVGVDENRYDLLQRHGKDQRLREAILAAPKAGQGPSSHAIGRTGLQSDLTDLVRVRHFWHRWTRALPEGRHVSYIGDQTELVVEANDFEVLPVARLTFGRFLLTCMGYTNAFDMQVPQEWFGAALSAKLTVLNTLGQPKIWIHEDDEPDIDELEPGSGIAIIKTRQPPQVLDFYSRGGEGLAEDLSLAISQQEFMAGTNPISRGQPEGELKGAPAAAMALLDSKALQASSVHVKLYKEFLGEVGTIAIRILQARATSRRVMAAVGEGNQTKLLEWSKENLDRVERVTVEVGTPLQRSYFGRTQLAESLKSEGWITTPQEFLTVIETGQWRPLVDSVESQLSNIAEENQRLIENERLNEDLLTALEQAQSMEDLELVKYLLQQAGVIALRTDNQILHLRRNLSILDTTEVRMTRGIAIPTLAHGWCHLRMLMDPQIQREQLFLGYLTGEQLQSFLASMQIPMGAPMGVPQIGGSAGPPPGPGGPTASEAVPDGAVAGPESSTPAPMVQTGRVPQAKRIPQRAVNAHILQGAQP
jgi:hypothetical protein